MSLGDRRMVLLEGDGGQLHGHAYLPNNVCGCPVLIWNRSVYQYHRSEPARENHQLPGVVYRQVFAVWDVELSKGDQS